MEKITATIESNDTKSTSTSSKPVTTPQRNQLDPETLKKLLDAAEAVKSNAYCIYSKFNVGAAILTSDGEIIPGCNVENASYGNTICAERTAMCTAIAKGKKKFLACAVTTNVMDFAYPCGACRQALREFSNPKEMLMVMFYGPEQKQIHHSLDEILPFSFGPDDLLNSDGQSKW